MFKAVKLEFQITLEHTYICLCCIQKCQHEIRHALPLGSDLLEPVQRVLRYHILLQKILTNLQAGEHGYEEIKVC